MEILEMMAYGGRNVHSHHPVIEMKINLGEYADCATNRIPEFNRLLLEVLPSIGEHHCSRGRPGGFRERLQEGTYLGHVLEHLILELMSLSGLKASYGKTRSAGEEGIYRVIYDSPCEEAAMYAGRAGLSLITDILAGKKPDARPVVEEIQRVAARTGLGPSTAAIVSAAEQRGIPWFRLGEGSLLQLGHGKHQKRVCATVTALTSCIGADIAGDKALTKKLLGEAGVPVPWGGLAYNEKEALEIAREIRGPVVVKPYNGNQGKGVTLNLATEKEIRAAFNVARTYSDGIIVERYIHGRHYRVLVVGGRVAAVSERIPAHVIGDGVLSIRQLLDQVNSDPRRGDDHEKPLTKIRIDPVALMVLARQGLTLDAVPEAGKLVYLRENANLSTGGVAVDATDEICAENRRLCIRAAQAVGLDVAGVDLVVEDPCRPAVQTGGAVIEVNAAPGIRMHHYPLSGQPRDAAGAIVDWIFPEGSPVRIPIVSVTGTNGKTTTTRIIAHILSTTGLTVGVTTSDGIYIGGERIVKGDTTGPRSARTVLQDPEVEAAVLETARGGIIRGGLGYDLADVGVVTNVSDDHLGQDGIIDLDDLAWVKSLVVEAIKNDGTAVLNADDTRVLAMAERARCRLAYFSLEADNIFLRKHCSEEGLGVYVKGGAITAMKEGKEERIASLRSVPCVLGGKAVHNIQNALAATAAALALGVSADVIRSALKSFAKNPEQNPGRLNLIAVGDVRLVVDYGHNAAGYEAAIRTARQLAPARLIGVIGSPGDRLDDAIMNLGRVAGKGFDFVFVKEDSDLRGRASREVAELLRQGVVEGGLEESGIRVILPEGEAIREALKSARSGDVVLVFYEKLEAVMAAAEEARSEIAARPAVDLAMAEPSVG